MRLNVPTLGQRDQQWSNVILGYNTDPQYSIGMYGCLITCLSMLAGKTPRETNDTLKANNGFTAGSGNFIWSKSTVLGLNEQYVSPRYDGPVTDLITQKAKDFISSGFPVLCEVDFNPATVGEEMHYVLLTGWEGDQFFINDPWTGDSCSMDKYGGFKRGVIQYRVYDKKFVQGGVKPTVEVFTDVFEQLVNKSSAVDAICKILGIEYSHDILINKINTQNDYQKSLEDQNRAKDKAISDAQTQISALQDTVDKLKKSNESLQSELAALKSDMDLKTGSLKAELMSKNNEITVLQNDLDTLKKNVAVPTLSRLQLLLKALFGR